MRGPDGLTEAEGREYEARFWKVANAPSPPEARLRAEDELAAGQRVMVHLVDQLEINCSTGDAREVLLDAAESAPVHQIWVQAAAARSAEDRRQAALDRLRAAARHDEYLADILTALGLE
jgi:hypothetical protein